LETPRPQEEIIPDEKANQPDRRSLSVAPRQRGVAIYAPDFYVWEPDGESAYAWASELWAAPRDAASRGERR
jgi:hypothetical protein